MFNMYFQVNSLLSLSNLDFSMSLDTLIYYRGIIYLSMAVIALL